MLPPIKKQNKININIMRVDKTSSPPRNNHNDMHGLMHVGFI